jgi:hypothetical protein
MRQLFPSAMPQRGVLGIGWVGLRKPSNCAHPGVGTLGIASD